MYREYQVGASAKETVKMSSGETGRSRPRAKRTEATQQLEAMSAAQGRHVLCPRW